MPLPFSEVLEKFELFTMAFSILFIDIFQCIVIHDSQYALR